MTKRPGTSRHHLRREGVLYELSIAYGLGEYETRTGSGPRLGSTHAAENLSLTTSHPSRPLTDDEQDLLDRMVAPDWLIKLAVPGYTRFRRQVEAIVNEHRKTLDWLVRTSRMEDAVQRFMSLEAAGPGGRRQRQPRNFSTTCSS